MVFSMIGEGLTPPLYSVHSTSVRAMLITSRKLQIRATGRRKTFMDYHFTSVRAWVITLG